MKQIPESARPEFDEQEDSRTPFSDASYKKLPVDDLVVYAVKTILEAGEECTFDRLVYECYTLFPKQFSFQRYPQWPDSARVNKSWLRCRTDKGLLVGSVKEGFQLTPKGERLAAAVEKRLSLKKPEKLPEPGRARERYEAVTRYLRRSEAFQRYSTDPTAFSISEGELRRLLSGTLETPRRVLRENFHFYLDAAKQYGEAQILGFLEACRSTAESMFQGRR